MTGTVFLQSKYISSNPRINKLLTYRLNHSVNPNKKKIGKSVFQSKENMQNIVQKWEKLKKTRDMEIS